MKIVKFTSKFNEPTVNLIVKGQGIYVFNVNKNKSNNKVKFSMLNSDKSDGLEVTFSNKNINVMNIKTKTKYSDSNNSSGLINYEGVYYWFSLDSQNQIFYAGIGEPRIENVKYEYKFDMTRDPNLVEENKLFLESITQVELLNTSVIKIIKDPITLKLPLKVIGTDDLTMMIIGNNDYMPISNLSITSQQLYNCISGKKFTLNDDDFPDFSAAIEYSIRTKGLWCYEKLKEKSTEFNKDKPNELETYLRITLGQNNGESPGIPNVMEIWPPGHYSPVHSHAGAEGIIRVLHGEINVNLYPFLCGQLDGIKSFGNESFKQGDFTWVSSELNQTHQLKNLHTDVTCMTIQCYMYDPNNSVHYDYFDYINDKGSIEHYEPNSDMDYVAFRKLMKEEWTNYLNSVNTTKSTKKIKK